jgi:nicotinamide-nucleotide amidase
VKIEIICTGTELLIGHTLNTNLQFLGRELDTAGYEIAEERTVPDGGEAIGAAVGQALAAGADVVITIGGLGPTCDDLTRDAVAAQLGTRLKFDATVHAAIVAYLGERSIRVPADALRLQAMVPEGATALLNRNGTAPGLWCPAPENRLVVMLPGPPRELRPMFLEQVLPRLRERGPATVLRCGFHVCGVPESVVAERAERILTEFPGIAPAYCARLGEVDVRLSAPPACAPTLTAALNAVHAAFGPAALPPQCPDPAAAVGDLLLRRGWWLALAESCTGGWIAKTLTDRPGASRFFCGSVVSYSNDWKHTLLDVSADTLAQHGAVSAETAGAMLDALFRRYEADAGIAVTGIAGPGGGTPEKPVGLVYIASGIRGRPPQVACSLFPGDREGIRQRTVTLALNQLRLQLLQA